MRKKIRCILKVGTSPEPDDLPTIEVFDYDPIAAYTNVSILID